MKELTDDLKRKYRRRSEGIPDRNGEMRGQGVFERCLHPLIPRSKATRFNINENDGPQRILLHID